MSEKYDPKQNEAADKSNENKAEDNTSTRMIILSPTANISQTELVQRLHMLEMPVTIKSTCYGAMVHGEKEVVEEVIEKARQWDTYNIFTKDRGFPPGDPRRCRGHRGAAREGYHQLEKEFDLLCHVGEALKKPQKVKIDKVEKITVDDFKKIVKHKASKIKDEGEK